MDSSCRRRVLAAQQSASRVTGKSRMNAERTVLSTHRFVTTPQTTSSRTSRPRSSGSSEVDAEVQVCTNGPNTLVSSRKPDDLLAFCEQLVKAFAEQALPA